MLNVNNIQKIVNKNINIIVQIKHFGFCEASFLQGSADITWCL